MNETFADYARPQILVKAAPLILIAIGLSFGLGLIFGISVQKVNL